ncbi:ester cyclase, partial [Chloroflexota bacterium]
MMKPAQRSEETEANNRITATRFIEAFNTDNWEAIRQVVAPDYIFHHPVGGTVQAGPKGMVTTWAGFKAALPDSWHPIPVMITEGDYVAVLLPTYGNFTGKPYHGIPPTGKWLEYGMVNIVRLQNGKIAEAWFGMDSFAEMQQMGAAPSLPPRELNETEKVNIRLFQRTINIENQEYDNLTAFNDVVIALGPPQYVKDNNTRRIDIYRATNGSLALINTHQLMTNPPYSGDPSVDKETSQSLVEDWFKEVLIGHNLKSIDSIALPHILVHRTAMPCEASYYGINGVKQWIGEQWSSFPNLTITDHFCLAQGDIVAACWTAQGTSEGYFLTLPP